MTSDLALCTAFIDAHPDDAARGCEGLTTAQAAALIQALSPLAAARVLVRMMPSAATACLVTLDPGTAATLLSGMRPDQAAGLLRRLDYDAQRAVLERMDADAASSLHVLLRYPAGTAGALMDSRILVAPATRQAGQVLTQLRRTRRPHEAVFVVDDEQRLSGVVELRTLVTSRRQATLADIMVRSAGRIAAHSGREAILRHPGWSRFHTLAVVDGPVLVGAIGWSTRQALSDEEDSRIVRRPNATATIVALGELYWVGLSGAIDGMAAAVRRAAPPDTRRDGSRDGGR